MSAVEIKPGTATQPSTCCRAHTDFSFEDHMADVMTFDHILTPDDFGAVNHFVREVEKEPTLYGVSIWQDNEENPLASKRAFAWASTAVTALLPTGMSLKDIEAFTNLSIYPTGTPIDHVFKAITDRVEEIRDVVGELGSDWVGIVSKTYAYSRGTKANWHADDGPYSGAFVYYAHDNWDKDWGGHFLYCDSAAMQDDGPTRGSFLSPLPNRLLLLRGGTVHTVSNVSQSAGLNSRLTVAGFFLRPEGIPTLIEESMRDHQLREG
jgi:hypothetical protein